MKASHSQHNEDNVDDADHGSIDAGVIAYDTKVTVSEYSWSFGVIAGMA